MLMIHHARAVHCGAVLLWWLYKSGELYVMGEGVSRMAIKESNK